MAHSSEKNGFDFNTELVRSMPSALRIIRSRIRNRGDAEDALQSALVRALEHKDAYVDTNMPSWLATIAINHFFSEAKTAQRRRAAVENILMNEPQILGHVPAPAALTLLENAEEARETSECLILIDAHLHSLTPDHREAVTAKLEFEGYSKKGAKHSGIPQNTQVARKIGIPEGTFKSRASRGMEKLRLNVYTELVGHMVDEITVDVLKPSAEARPRDAKE